MEQEGWLTQSVCLGQSGGGFQTLPRVQPQSWMSPGAAQILLSVFHTLALNPSTCLSAYFLSIQTRRILSP